MAFNTSIVFIFFIRFNQYLLMKFEYIKSCFRLLFSEFWLNKTAVIKCKVLYDLFLTQLGRAVPSEGATNQIGMMPKLCSYGAHKFSKLFVISVKMSAALTF